MAKLFITLASLSGMLAVVLGAHPGAASLTNVHHALRELTIELGHELVGSGIQEEGERASVSHDAGLNDGPSLVHDAPIVTLVPL